MTGRQRLEVGLLAIAFGWSLHAIPQDLQFAVDLSRGHGSPNLLLGALHALLTASALLFLIRGGIGAKRAMRLESRADRKERQRLTRIWRADAGIDPLHQKNWLTFALQSNSLLHLLILAPISLTLRAGRWLWRRAKQREARRNV